MRGMNAPRVLFALALAAMSTPAGLAAPSVVMETHVVLTIEAMILEDGKSKNAAEARQVEIGPF